MARRMPPLNALRAFDAAARHLSFTKAAKELFVTQAAISHQVKGLERHLGFPLFRRMNRRLMLSDAGQAYLPALREAFDKIEAATQRLYADEEGGSLRVSCLPSFAAKWLLPRLGRFSERQPDIDVLVSASDTLVDFNQEQIDIAIRHGPGKYPGLRVDLLMDDEVLPVCSPRLLAGPKPLKEAADLKHHVLLHDDMGRQDHSYQDWTTWLQAVGVKGVKSTRGPAFSHSNMVIQAAIDGQGIALGRRSLTGDDLAAGRLVSPFGPVVPARFSYWVVAPLSSADRPKVRHFREWLLEEAKAGESPQALPSSRA